MRMQMSQCALIWICVSAISLNNNHRITITRDLRDLTSQHVGNKKKRCSGFRESYALLIDPAHSENFRIFNIMFKNLICEI